MGWETIPEGLESHPEGRVAESKGLEALLEGLDGSSGPPRSPKLVGRPSWKSGTGREALPVGRDGSGGLL